MSSRLNTLWLVKLIQRLWVALVTVGILLFSPAITKADAVGTPLEKVWNWSMAREPGYQQAALAHRAGEAEAEALERERRPVFSVSASGDFGQRARPGEERDQGATAARGDLLARLDWLVQDSAREARKRAVTLRRAGVVEAEAAFDLSFRAEVARTYIHSSATELQRSILADHDQRFNDISNLVHLRIRKGVESPVTLEWLDNARTRLRNELAQAKYQADLASRTLAAFAGKEVFPQPVFPNPSSIAGTVPSAVSDSPPVVALEREAEVLRAEADVLRKEDRWRIGAFAAGGPYFSQAFSGATEPEYIGGIRITWTPDLSGVRQSRAIANRRKAGAMQAEARSEARRLERRAAEIAQSASTFSERKRGLREAVEGAAAQERISLLRWRNGVGGWRDLLEALENRTRAELELLDWQTSFALKAVEYAEITNRLEALPAWLGQTNETGL